MASTEEMIPLLTGTDILIKIRITDKDQTQEAETMEEDLNPMILSGQETPETLILKDSLFQMKTNQLSSQ